MKMLNEHIEKILYKSNYKIGKSIPKKSLINEEFINEIKASDAKEKFYKDINKDVYEKLISADPTYDPQKDIFGKYSKWLLKQYKDKNLKEEDIYKVEEYLKYFDKYKNKLQKKDINQYQKPSDVYSAVKTFIDKEKEGSEDVMSNKALSTKIKTEEAEKVYEDQHWTVIVPETERAACYYGKGTQWCTAAERSQNRFDQYNKDGKLYIIISKENPEEKYQFHFESGQFMDVNDDPINVVGFLDNKKNEGLLEFIETKIPETFHYNDLKFTKKDNEYYVLFNDYSDFTDLFILGRDTNEDFIKDVLSGMGHEYFEYYDYEPDIEYYIDDINDENRETIEKITGVSFEEFKDDIEEYEDVKEILSRSIISAQESADESEAYNNLTDSIFSAFNVHNPNVTYLDNQMQFDISKKTFVLGYFSSNSEGDDEDLRIEYYPPRNGYHGTIDNKYLNEIISNELAELE